MFKFLAAGTIDNPYTKLGLNGPIVASDPDKPGAFIFLLLGNFFKMIIVVAGLYALFNIVLAGIQFIGAGGDAKKVTAAWEKIYQTILGLFIAGASITIAALIGYIVFKDPTFLITPRLITPT
jgi:hypothetical protein